MWRISATAGAVGIEIIAALAVGYLGGQWLDRKLGTAPWLKWIGTVAGIGAAIKALVRIVRQYNRMSGQQDNDGSGANKN